FFVQQQMFRLTTFSQGVNMRMLNKNEVVFGSYRSIVSAISCFLSNSIFQKCFLSFPGFLIINYTPILKKNFFILHHISLIYKFTDCKRMLKSNRLLFRSLPSNADYNPDREAEHVKLPLLHIETPIFRYSVLMRFLFFPAI